MKFKNSLPNAIILNFILIILPSCNKLKEDESNPGREKYQVFEFYQSYHNDSLLLTFLKETNFNIYVKYNNLQCNFLLDYCKYENGMLYKNLNLKYEKDIFRATYGTTLIEYQYLLEGTTQTNIKIFIRTKYNASKEATGAIIKWVNTPRNKLFIDDLIIKNKTTGEIDTFKSNRIAEPVFNWSIDETTDTIFTNIDKNIIYKVFPKFKGRYVYYRIKEIIINDSINRNNAEFYEDIKIID